MSFLLYDLAGADSERRFSPYCWRVKLAAAHKGIDLPTKPWRFTEKDAIADSGQGAVPVLETESGMINDSWTIAGYLEDEFPDKPTLFGGETGKAHCRFIAHWAEQTIKPVITKIIIADIYNRLHPKDRDYFRSTREKRFGTTLEDFQDQSGDQVEKLRRALAPMRSTLEQSPYLSGDKPAFADYILLSLFLWAYSASEIQLLAADDPIHAWQAKLLDRFKAVDGMAACHLPR